MRLRVDDPALRADLHYLWADCSGVLGEPDFVVRVRGLGPWQVESAVHNEACADRASAVGAACAAVNVTLATQTPLLAVHAAVVVKRGVTLLIPGQSGAGKTTLAVALLQQGWAYATDEAYAIDWESDLAPAYPRPLGISDWTAKTLAVTGGVPGPEERFMRAGDLGVVAVTDPLAIRHIILLDRSGCDSTASPSLTSAHRVDALETMLRESFTHYRRPELALLRLTDVVKAAEVWRLRYGDPAAAALFVDGAFAR
ncbi:MAG: hypothetical protein ACRDV3_05575 [Acidothermaceae bacterium]